VSEDDGRRKRPRTRLDEIMDRVVCPLKQALYAAENLGMNADLVADLRANTETATSLAAMHKTPLKVKK